MIQITDYQTLLEAAKQQTEPQRFLFVFLQAVLPDNPTAEEKKRFHAGQGGQLRPIMCVDKGLDELGTFSDLVEESKKMEQDWHIVLVGCLSGSLGKMPDQSRIDEQLKSMVNTVKDGGSLSRFLAFNRNGEPMQFG